MPVPETLMGIRFAPSYYYFLLRFKGSTTLVESKHTRKKTLLPYLQKPESPPERNGQG
jgi:hypothetical protein